MGKLVAIFSALRCGSALTDPALWKNRQNATNAVVGLLAAGLAFYPIEGLGANEQAAIGGAIAVIGSLINAYLTTATTEKIGLPATSAEIEVDEVEVEVEVVECEEVEPVRDPLRRVADDFNRDIYGPG